MSKASSLRLINPGEAAAVSIAGVDDRGESPGSEVTTTIPAGASRTLTAQELEAGGDGFEGALGDGEGKWRLTVQSAQPLVVMSLLSDPTGHLSNLSTASGRESQARPDLVVEPPSVSNQGDADALEFTELRYCRSVGSRISTSDSEVGRSFVGGAGHRVATPRHTTACRSPDSTAPALAPSG